MKPYTAHLHKDTLAWHLYNWLKAHQGWQEKWEMYVVVGREEFSPDSASRELRRMAQHGIIKVDYYKGKRKQKLSKYSVGEIINNRPKVIIEIVDGLPVARMI